MPKVKKKTPAKSRRKSRKKPSGFFERLSDVAGRRGGVQGRAGEFVGERRSEPGDSVQQHPDEPRDGPYVRRADPFPFVHAAHQDQGPIIVGNLTARLGRAQ